MQAPIVVESLEDVCAAPIRARLEQDRFAIVRGVASAEEVLDAMSLARAAFNPHDDHAVTGESPADVRRNFQKWTIGMSSSAHRSSHYARMLRVIFTPLLDVDRYGVHALLRRVAVTRNRLLDLADDFAVDAIEDGLWTAARLQQYPSGAGFLGAHVDQVSVNAAPEGAANYVQVVLVMTQRGLDFERGGAFIEVEGSRVDLEDHVQVGDLLIYDELAVHGVADIDPHRVFDATRLTGRIAGFANLYRVL